MCASNKCLETSLLMMLTDCRKKPQYLGSFIVEINLTSWETDYSSGKKPTDWASEARKLEETFSLA